MRKIIATLALILGSIWIVYTYLPGLMSDSRTSDWVPAFDLKVEKAKCTVHWFVMSTCEVKYTDRQQPSVKAASIDHLVYGSWGNERFMLLRSAAHPEIVSTTLGVDGLKARWATMVLWIAVVLAMGVAFIFAHLPRDVTPRARMEPIAPAPSFRSPAPHATSAGRTEFGRRGSRA